ncbi:MAG: hypothetical protein F4154_01215 [Candidatus Dadabacteria bacterium]|nr:hypothetical protein [Candidatus Dadabacteria bacterium]
MKEKTMSLYTVFTRGKKVVAQGFKGMSPHAKYAELGLEKSKELTKLGYGYSLRGIRYSYYRGTDGLYYVKIPKAVPVLSTVKDYTGNIATLPTILPILSQASGLTISKH